MARTWKDNAAEFGALSKQGSDIRLALLAACSVQLDTGTGVGNGQRSVTNVTLPGKVSARAFATEAKVTLPRVLRHVKAWDRLAESPYRLVLPSADLRVRDTDGLRAFKGDDAWLADPADKTWREVFADASQKVNEEEPPGSRPRAPISEIDAALTDPKKGYATRLVDGLSDEGFAALVQAVDAVAHPAAVEPDPDLPEPPPAKPTKKRRIVDDWAAEKAKRDLAERQARLDAELERIKLDAIANGGRVIEPTPKPDVTMESMFGERFAAWTEIGLDGVADRLTAFRDRFGELHDEEMDVVRKYAVGLLDIAAGTHKWSSVGGVVPR